MKSRVEFDFQSFTVLIDAFGFPMTRRQFLAQHKEFKRSGRVVVDGHGTHTPITFHEKDGMFSVSLTAGHGSIPTFKEAKAKQQKLAGAVDSYFNEHGLCSADG